MWRQNGYSTVLSTPKNFYTPPKQISGYAPASAHSALGAVFGVDALYSSDGDDRESHSSADDTIIMSSRNNWAKV